jgi:hypothetical protein
MKATIQQHRGDLDAAERTCADMQIVLAWDPDSDILDSLQKRLAEFGTILKDLSKAQQQPITARTAFANYVKDSLLTMFKPKYKIHHQQVTF